MSEVLMSRDLTPEQRAAVAALIRRIQGSCPDATCAELAGVAVATWARWAAEGPPSEGRASAVAAGLGCHPEEVALVVVAGMEETCFRIRSDEGAEWVQIATRLHLPSGWHAEQAAGRYASRCGVQVPAYGAPVTK